MKGCRGGRGVRNCIPSVLAIVVALVVDCLWATAEWGTSEHLSGEECGLMGF